MSAAPTSAPASGAPSPGGDAAGANPIAALRWIALATGIVLFAATLYFVDVREAFATTVSLGPWLPLALLVSGVWHVVRTLAWAWSFPEPRPVRFAQLLRVRLAAEAFSYLTLRGVAGEPLKVLLLAGAADARQATAAVALERLAYMVGTTLIVGVGSVVALVALPLTALWFRVFRAFAIVAGVVALLTAAVILGRGTYLQSLMRSLDRLTGRSMASGRVGRFVASVERLMLDLVRTQPTRLARLSLCTLVAFACMVLEAWIILRAAGAAVTVTGASAVETFSRVASFASSVIPANIGALEASSVAAAAAVGLTGGAALAIARRIRGLLWAGIGLFIYPRQRPRHSSRRGRPDTPALLYVACDERLGVPPSARLAGVPMIERVIRSASRAGCVRVLVFAPSGGRWSAAIARAVHRLRHSVEAEVVVARDAAEWKAAIDAAGNEQAFTAIGAGTIVSPALIVEARHGAPRDQLAVDVPAGRAWPATGVLRVTRALASDVDALAARLARARDAADPLPTGEDVSSGHARLALRATTAAELRSAERTIRRSSYKDTDATIARFNRRLSLPISVALMRTPITANQISIALVAIGFYAAWLFSLGRYWPGVLAALLSLAASVLDGCDGEVARLKYQESALGCWIETIGDYSYYLAIFTGLAIGAVRQTHMEAFYWLGGLALGGTLLSFGLLIFLRARITAGRPERLHTVARARFTAEPSWWSRIIWRISFVATRAAMPYGIFVFALASALPAIVVLAALGANVYWISLVVKLRDLLGSDQERIAAV